ncbi:uncharacterized protein LOC134804491 [Cydia splendana]|uniref:uncharacterized protein LOC134804491 n=1 Tax=Cydia splendana TaxID=1100963 RepID=UPI00213F2062
MSSTKTFLCDACLILLVGIAFAVAEDKVVGSTTGLPETLKGNCTCGGFDSRGGSMPLVAHSPGLTVECGAAGNATCGNLCVALATATRAKGPEVLCNRIKACDELKLSVFYKICDGPWVAANMTAEEALCCENSKPKTCASAVSPSTAAASSPVTGAPV